MPSKSDQARADDVTEIRGLLRAANLRSTAARIAVFHQLRRANSPLTHAEVSEQLVPQGFDQATVFRNLGDLTEAGLVSRTELGDHVWRFEARDPNAPDKGSHPHFVCTECGSVTCLDDLQFTAASRRRSTQIGRITEILVKGQCADCVPT